LKHKQEDIKQMHCMVAILRKLMLLSIHEFTDFGESQIVCAISCCLSASVPILSNRNWWSCSFLFLLLYYQQWVYLIRVMRPFYYSVFKPGGFKTTCLLVQCFLGGWLFFPFTSTTNNDT
jgi:hypothetical protein